MLITNNFCDVCRFLMQSSAIAILACRSVSVPDTLISSQNDLTLANGFALYVWLIDWLIDKFASNAVLKIQSHLRHRMEGLWHYFYYHLAVFRKDTVFTVEKEHYCWWPLDVISHIACQVCFLENCRLISMVLLVY